MTEPDSIQRNLIVALGDGQLVSGADLASRLGISRAAVWKRITRLRELGLEISASAGSGYRLQRPLELLDELAIRSQLSDVASQRIDDVQVAWQLESTNSALMRSASDHANGATALLAEIQTGGRGRRGRQWRSTFGGSLVLSLRWRFDLPMGALAGLSVVAGLAVIESLHSTGTAGIGLKWPNDVVVNDHKLAGILIELGGEAQGPCHAVIGVGLNLFIDPATADLIDQPWIDLSSLAGTDTSTSRNALAAAVLSRLAEMLEQFERGGLAAFAELHARYDALVGRVVRVVSPAGEREGMAMGLDARGGLKVRGTGGEFVVESGEVSIRTSDALIKWTQMA